jgi:hypothetical protein
MCWVVISWSLKLESRYVVLGVDDWQGRCLLFESSINEERKGALRGMSAGGRSIAWYFRFTCEKTNSGELQPRRKFLYSGRWGAKKNPR